MWHIFQVAAGSARIPADFLRGDSPSRKGKRPLQIRSSYLKISKMFGTRVSFQSHCCIASPYRFTRISRWQALPFLGSIIAQRRLFHEYWELHGRCRLREKLPGLLLCTDKLRISLEPEIPSVWCLVIGLTVSQNQERLGSASSIWKYVPFPRLFATVFVLCGCLFECLFAEQQGV